MNFPRKPLIQGVLMLRSVLRVARPNPVFATLPQRSAFLGISGRENTNSSSSKIPDEYTRSEKFVFREVDEQGFRIPIEDSTQYTDEEKAHRKKMGRYYSLLIAGLVGFISSTFLLYTRMVNVEAKSVEDGASIQNEEDLIERGHQKNESEKKEEELALHKSKAGFRERKVSNELSLKEVYRLYAKTG